MEKFMLFIIGISFIGMLTLSNTDAKDIKATDKKEIQKDIIVVENKIAEAKTDVITTASVKPVKQKKVKWYTVSRKGKNFIKDVEKCNLTAYWDSNAYSIGYGHHNKSIKKNQTITKRQAEKFFEEDIKTVEADLNRMLSSLDKNVTYSQGFVDGLASLIYNCGAAGVQGTTFWKRMQNCRVKNGKLNKEDWVYTISTVKNTKISAPGHKERRQGEYNLMNA